MSDNSYMIQSINHFVKLAGAVRYLLLTRYGTVCELQLVLQRALHEKVITYSRILQ